MQIADRIIKISEGWQPKPYYCTAGLPTIGYGRVVGAKNTPLPNITTTREKEQAFLDQRIQEIVRQLSTRFPKAWTNCNDARKAILISMCYQLGFAGLSAFRKMWAAIEANDFPLACKEMLDSRWAKQTPNRANRHISQMRTGVVDPYYNNTRNIP